jgi:hypothetical protein
VEQYLKNAIGLDSPQITPEPKPRVEVEAQPKVTIYDFANLLLKNEPPKVRHCQIQVLRINTQLL